MLPMLLSFLPLLAYSVAAHRVAIIGAGAAGSSAAYWTSKAAARHDLNVTIDVYEREDYVGGSTF